jgi:hypothetical protein
MELLEPRVHAALSQHGGNALLRLGPLVHEPSVTREGTAALSRRQTNDQGEDVDDLVRKATTEALFRDVNERIAESAERFSADRTEFVCECADPTCTHRLEATLTEYEEVREDGTTFMLAAGHADAEIEHVVGDRGRFQIVQKVQATVRETVRRLNPRAHPAGA